MDDCNDTDCKFCHSNKCMFGVRQQAGCYMEVDKEIMDQYLNGLIKMRMAEEQLKFEGDIEASNILKDMRNKQYGFIYKGHEYTVADSARNQGLCPHCNLKAPDDEFWQITDEGYIGFNKEIGTHCFECPRCFDKFYYHGQENDI